MNTSVPLAALLLLTSSISAQNPPDPIGDWKGAIKAGGQELRVVLHVKGDPKKLTGTLDSVDQGANGIRVDSISLTGRRFTFEIERLRASFAGKFDSKGDGIDGTFTQGIDIPLRLERTREKIELHRPQMPKAPFPYRVEEVSYAHVPGKTGDASFAADATTAGKNAVKLAGTLTLPRGDGPFPAAVLISGSGPQDRDEALMGHKPFFVLADHLTRNGIAVLRYDDRGVGKSTGEFRNAVSDDFADDAEAGMRYLLTRKEVAKNKIGFIGHSEGGLVAPMVAARNPSVAFVVLMAGPGVPGTEILALQSQLISKANGVSEDRLAASKATNAKLFKLIEKEKDTGKLVTRMRAVLDEALEGLDATTAAEVGDPDAFAKKQIAKLTSPWMLRFLRYDPRPTLARVKCPVLAINGALDLQVDASQNLPEIEKALKRAGNPDFEVLALPKLNHLFQHAETGSPSEYAKIEETLATEALDAITKFVRKRFAK